MKAVTGTRTIEAPAARSRCQESSRPIGALSAAIAAETAIIAGSRLVTSAAAAGGAISIPSTSSAPTTRNPTTTARVITTSITSWRQVHPQTQRRRALAVEGEQQERAGRARRRAPSTVDRQQRGDDDVGPLDAEHVAEQERGQVDRVALGARDQDHAEGEHEHEHDRGRRLLAQPAAAQDQAGRDRRHQPGHQRADPDRELVGLGARRAPPAVSMNATAIPGRTPWARLSAISAMPRRTT